jgi:hypothetical protein
LAPDSDLLYDDDLSLAYWLAADAYEDLLGPRFGCYRVNSSDYYSWDDRKPLCLFDTTAYPGPKWRRRQLARFRQRLGPLGLREIAYAFYPNSKPGKDCTVTLLLDGYSPGMEERVRGIYEEEIRRTLKEMDEEWLAECDRFDEKFLKETAG